MTDQDPRTPNDRRTRPPGFGPTWPRWAPWAVIAIVLGGFLFAQNLAAGSNAETISETQFLSSVSDGNVKDVQFEVGSGSITGTLKDGSKFKAQCACYDTLPDRIVTALDENNVEYEGKAIESSFIGELITFLLPILIIVGILIWMNRRAQGSMGAVMNISRSRAKVYTTEKPKTTFTDVAGYAPVKEEIEEVVDFLKHPGKFREIGARIPKGVLLVGPPGTGKTLIARAVAGEAGVPFVSVTGSDFMEMFVGVGAARVRDLFQTARRQAPAIIFIDEIDSIGRKRGAGVGGGHDEREQTLNQMLAEMDGFEATEGIVMMAATNRPDVLDPALLRPGRFDRQVLVPLPTQEERFDILKVHLRDKKVSGDVDPQIVARATPGMSGADLANLVNEAALFAVRRGAQEVHAADFDAARDRVLMGLKRPSIVMNEREKLITAYHESGHAMLAYLLPHADPVHKVTILPTGMALGMTQQLPLEEKHSYNRQYLQDMLVVMLGGRVSEQVVFQEQSTGAQNDLVRVTEIARSMVREWGMSERIGPMAWGSQGAVFLGEDLMHTRDYSDDTARVIDEEVEHILRAEEARAIEVLTEHRAGLDALAHALVERETLDGGEVASIVDQAMGRAVGDGARAPQITIAAESE